MRNACGENGKDGWMDDKKGGSQTEIYEKDMAKESHVHACNCATVGYVCFHFDVLKAASIMMKLNSRFYAAI